MWPRPRKKRPQVADLPQLVAEGTLGKASRGGRDHVSMQDTLADLGVRVGTQGRSSRSPTGDAPSHTSRHHEVPHRNHCRGGIPRCGSAEGTARSGARRGRWRRRRRGESAAGAARPAGTRARGGCHTSLPVAAPCGLRRPAAPRASSSSYHHPPRLSRCRRSAARSRPSWPPSACVHRPAAGEQRLEPSVSVAPRPRPSSSAVSRSARRLSARRRSSRSRVSSSVWTMSASC